MATLSINGSVAATDKCLRRILRHKTVAPAIARVTVLFRRQASSLLRGDSTVPCPCRSIQFLRKQAGGPWYVFLLDRELRSWVKQQRFFLAALALYVGLFWLCRGWILSPAAGVSHGFFDSSVCLLQLPPAGIVNQEPPDSAQPFKPVPKEIPFRVNPSVPMQAATMPDPMASIKILCPVIPRPAFRPSLSGVKALSGGKGTGEGYGAGRGTGLGNGDGKFKVISGHVCGTAAGSGMRSDIPRDFVFNLVASKREVRGVELILNLQAYNVPDQFEIIYRDRVVWRIDLPDDLDAENYAKYEEGVTAWRIILDEEGKVIKSSITGNFKTTASGKSNITSGSGGAVQCVERWARPSSPEGKLCEWVNCYYDLFDVGSYDRARQVILRVHSSLPGTEWNLAADINFYVE